MESKAIASILFLFVAGLVLCIEEDGDLMAKETINSNKQNEGSTLQYRTNVRSNNQTKQQHEHLIKVVKVNENAESSKYSMKITNPFEYEVYSSRKSFSPNIKKPENNTIITIDSKINPRHLKNQNFNTEANTYKIETENVSGEEFLDAGKKWDMEFASSMNTKAAKVTTIKEEDEEKTLAQQVADGKYGLIQDEIFANGSKRPGILSYLANPEIPKDTKLNLGGLEKDEIWLAEDHILVLRGGKLKGQDENETSASLWPPIDDYIAPNRQVKIPNNPGVPPPFPVQLTEDGPLEFVKGKKNSGKLPFPTLPFLTNKIPLLPNGISEFITQSEKNQSLPTPPLSFPPFWANFPPGSTFLTPHVNASNIDEDDPSIYYPPKYDFYYPIDNDTLVPPGPLVPGIVLPPPPDFFSPLENKTSVKKEDEKNETDINLNIIAQSPVGRKYLPVENNQLPKSRILNHRNFKQTASHERDAVIVSKLTKTSADPKNSLQNSVSDQIHPEKPFNSLKIIKASNLKVPEEETIKNFKSTVVKTNKKGAVYHPLPTTSPKPNHITLPNNLSKDIYIVTTTEVEHVVEGTHKKSKEIKPNVYETITPELHPLRSLLRPNVSVSYTGKYGHLPASTPFAFSQSDKQFHVTSGHYITQKPPDIMQNTVTFTSDVNITPIPIVKKIPIRPILPENMNTPSPIINPTKATFYFYEETSKTEAPKKIVHLLEATKQGAPNKPESHNEIGLITQYYNSPTSTNKTPIRQFLEETFHASNIFQSHNHNAEINDKGTLKEEKSNIKQVYKNNNSPNPKTKYQYITEVSPILIPNLEIKTLEIQNSGSTGLQEINADKAKVLSAPTPYFTQKIIPSSSPKNLNPFSSPYSPLNPTKNVHPFIPSNYYVTPRPEQIHFTAQEQSLVDDITKNYFTIFGQKISPSSTTPLTPIKTVKSSGFLNTGGRNIQIIPEPGVTSSRPIHTRNYNKTTVVKTSPSAQSHFEQYLKELTGEDQRDYIITNIQDSIKKGKEFFSLGSISSVFPPHLYSSGTIPFQPYRVDASVRPYPNVGNSRKVIYSPNYSTTLRPVVDIEINPQVIQQVGSTSRPIRIVQSSIRDQKVPSALNVGQYLQEITGFNNPTNINPARVKSRPTKLLFLSTGSPFQNVNFQSPNLSNVKEGQLKGPISLESDTVVNFKPPLPPTNQNAEIIKPINGKKLKQSSFVGPGENIKIIDSPDLTKEENILLQSESLPAKNNFDPAKRFLQNLPASKYFSPSYQPSTNSFVSYNLPGNSGHFYFLTPQILAKSNADQEIPKNRNKYHEVQVPIRFQRNKNLHNINYRRNYSTALDLNMTNNYSNHEYIRRRRKKS